MIGYLLAPVAHYDNPVIKQLIYKFKYEGWLGAADPLCELTRAYLEKLPANGRGFMVMPIPLHPKRELKRGFNQSSILASYIAKYLNVEIVKNNLVRIKNTSAQAELKDYKAREKNLSSAFHLNKPEELKSKSVILVDDVFTSGATLNEAAHTLKSAGVRKIIALVLARAR